MEFGTGIGAGTGTGTGLYYFSSYWKLRFMGHRIRVIWFTGLFGVFGFLFLVFFFLFSAVRRQDGMEWEGMGSQPTGKKEASLTEPPIRNCLLALILLYIFM